MKTKQKIQAFFECLQHSLLAPRPWRTDWSHPVTVDDDNGEVVHRVLELLHHLVEGLPHVRRKLHVHLRLVHQRELTVEAIIGLQVLDLAEEGKEEALGRT